MSLARYTGQSRHLLGRLHRRLRGSRPRRGDHRPGTKRRVQGTPRERRSRVRGAVTAMARKEVRHGDHGPEPRFEGDCWTAWNVCSECRRPVDPWDKECRHCGAELEEEHHG